MGLHLELGIRNDLILNILHELNVNWTELRLNRTDFYRNSEAST